MNEKTHTSGAVRWLLRIVATIAVIAWMVVIFLMSADNAEESSRKSEEVVDLVIDVAVGVKLTTREAVTPSVRETIGFYVRKAGHAAEYAILGVLLVLALAAWGLQRLPARAAIALPVAAAYAASDEYHQLSVSGRSGEWRDVLIDISGAAIGILLVLLVMRIARRKRGRKS